MKTLLDLLRAPVMLLATAFMLWAGLNSFWPLFSGSEKLLSTLIKFSSTSTITSWCAWWIFTSALFALIFTTNFRSRVLSRSIYYFTVGGLSLGLVFGLVYAVTTNVYVLVVIGPLYLLGPSLASGVVAGLTLTWTTSETSESKVTAKA